jgi:Zn-dependent protease
MVQCDKCGKDEYMPFRCKYCGGYFCAEHRLPEMHNCTGYYQYSRSTTGSTGFTPTGFSYAPQQQGGSFGFSQREIRDLAIGLLLILGILFTTGWRTLIDYPTVLAGGLIIFTLAFLLHELAHKFMAQKLGYWAEFRINQQGVLITLLSFISPFKIIAPGAVMIAGLMNWDDYGRVSIAGPATNIGMGLIYFVISLLTGGPIMDFLLYLGMNINASLALFNLIPLGVFDGAKIMKWNKTVWGAAIVTAGLLYVYSNFIY